MGPSALVSFLEYMVPEWFALAVLAVATLFWVSTVLRRRLERMREHRAKMDRLARLGPEQSRRRKPRADPWDGSR